MSGRPKPPNPPPPPAPADDDPEGDDLDGALAARGATSEISKTERILNLVAFLLKERRPVPWRGIAGRVVGYDDGSDPKSLERRFERDKSALKEMGVKIVYCPPGMHETEGYLIPREACFLDKLELLPHESALLNLLSELALRKGGSSFSADLMSALQKLRFDAPGTSHAPALSQRSTVNFPPLEPGEAPPEPSPDPAAPGLPGAEAPSSGKRKRGRPPKAKGAGGGDATPVGGAAGAKPGEAARAGSALESSILDLDLAASLRTDPNLETLTQALLANQRVAFTYFSMRSGEKRRRELDPYGIGFSRGAWYVVGHDQFRSKIQQFRLDRIEGAVELAGPERAFKAPKGFKVTDYLEKLPWEMADTPPVEAVIEVGRDIAFFVEDLVAGKGAAEERDGSAIVRLEVRDRSAFVRWVLPHMRHVKVIGPKVLQDELAEELRKLRERYSS